MIKSFKDKRTEALYRSRKAKGFPPDIVERARRKLAAVNATNALDDLRVPPSNRLEQLRGDRANGVYVSTGTTEMRWTSRSASITEA
jgi:proteic killer suppression protein